MAAQRRLGRDKGLEIVVVVVRCSAAPFGVGGRRGVLRRARGDIRRLLGKNVLHAGVEGLLDFGTGAEIGRHPLLGAGLEGVRRAFAVARMVTAEGKSGVLALGKFGLGGRLLAPVRGAVLIGPLKQRIALKLVLDEGHQVEIGQLQQLDRLHELRRHYQRLRLAEL